MFKNTFQKDFVTILFSCGSKPLALWDRVVRNGHIKRVSDDEVKSLVLEIAGTNVATTFVTIPRDPYGSLGIRLSFFVMTIKNLKKYFSFEITILDDKNMRRRLRASNYQSVTRVRDFCCTMPICLNPGWNQVQFNLADFCRRAYGTSYVECVRVQVHANCRLRRIYFSDRLYSEDELPADYKVFDPHKKKGRDSEQASLQHLQQLQQQGLHLVQQAPPPPALKFHPAEEFPQEQFPQEQFQQEQFQQEQFQQEQFQQEDFQEELLLQPEQLQEEDELQGYQVV